MEDKILKESDIPMGYELCFNGGCADKDTCMHYQAMLLTSADRYKGNAVFPTAWQDGKCRCYHEKKLVKKAWGFTNLYNNVPHYTAGGNTTDSISIRPPRRHQVRRL